MQLDVCADAEAVAGLGAEIIAAAAREAITAHGIFTLAVSGGRTPARMFEVLGQAKLDWRAVHVFQVDERVAPADDPERNLTQLAPLAAAHVHAMPVGDTDPDAAASRYARELTRICGAPAVLDLVHLGLGADGHTASLVPGDAVLQVRDRDVAPSGVYAGRRRLTLTFPALDRARARLWLVTGAEKSAMLARLLTADASIPAGRVSQVRARVLADTDAASSAGSG
jgi:6-phosphogluconolactonase